MVLFYWFLLYSLIVSFLCRWWWTQLPSCGNNFQRALAAARQRAMQFHMTTPWAMRIHRDVVPLQLLGSLYQKIWTQGHHERVWGHRNAHFRKVLSHELEWWPECLDFILFRHPTSRGRWRQRDMRCKSTWLLPELGLPAQQGHRKHCLEWCWDCNSH